MEWGPHAKSLEKLQRGGGGLPPQRVAALERKPTLLPDLGWVLNAFEVLSRRRPWRQVRTQDGYSDRPGAIPLTEVQAMLSMYRVPEHRVAHYLHLFEVLDSAWVRQWRGGSGGASEEISHGDDSGSG